MAKKRPPPEPARWLLLVYRVPQEPPGRRTYAWRQLKQLGAVYLQQAAAVLPDQPVIREALKKLSERIRSYEGEVSLLETVSPDDVWERGTIERFNRARAEEYAEVIENVERFEDEVRRESGKGKFTFAELEDLESDLEKIEQWVMRVRQRDFFKAPSEHDAEQALAAGRVALEQFSDEVYRRAGVQGDGGDDRL